MFVVCIVRVKRLNSQQADTFSPFRFFIRLRNYQVYILGKSSLLLVVLVDKNEIATIVRPSNVLRFSNRFFCFFTVVHTSTVILVYVRHTLLSTNVNLQ